MKKSSLGRQRQPENIIDRVKALQTRVDVLERLMLTKEAADTVYVPSADAVFSGAQVYNSSAFTITNNTLTLLTYNSERYDTDDYHSTSSNTDRMTVPSDGYYLLVANVSWNSNTNGYRNLTINTSLRGAVGQVLGPPGSIGPHQVCVAVAEMSAGDYAYVRVSQNSGGNLGISATGSGTDFSITRIG